MNYKYGGIIAIAVVCIWSIVRSDTLFEDPFDTKENWVVTVGTVTESIANGWYTIQSNSTSLSILKHSESFSEFTYTVKLKVQSDNDQGCSILFCVQDNLEGYMFTITANEQYYLGKWKVQGNQVTFIPLTVNWNSYIGDADNTLKVSKSGGDIYLFVNNIFLEKFTDNEFNQGGAIGIAVGKGEKASFDHALVTDEMDTGTSITWFFDKFEDSNLYGWRMLKGDGTIKSEDGVMKAAPIDSTMIFYTNGNFKDMPCTTLVTYKSGNKQANYGIIFMNIQPSQSIGAYCYFINANRQYSIFSMGDTYSPIANSNIHGVTDTLITTKDFNFIVNGIVVDDSTLTQGLNFNAVGVYIEPGLSVEFDDFSAGEYDGTSIKHKPKKGIYTKVKSGYILGGIGLIYDTKGRKVAEFQGNYKEKLKDLSSGPYYILIPDGDKYHIIRRAIINTR